MKTARAPKGSTYAKLGPSLRKAVDESLDRNGGDRNSMRDVRDAAQLVERNRKRVEDVPGIERLTSTEVQIFSLCRSMPDGKGYTVEDFTRIQLRAEAHNYTEAEERDDNMPERIKMLERAAVRLAREMLEANVGADHVRKPLRAGFQTALDFLDVWSK